MRLAVVAHPTLLAEVHEDRRKAPSRLLPELPGKRRLKALPRLDVASGDVPAPGEEWPRRRAAQEEGAVRLDDDGAHDETWREHAPRAHLAPRDRREEGEHRLEDPFRLPHRAEVTCIRRPNVAGGGDRRAACAAFAAWAN